MSNPFNSFRPDLGTSDSIGYDKEAVDNILKASQYPHTYSCVICQQPSKHKVIPKYPQDNTAEMQKGVYICPYHLQVGVIDPNRYGIREIH